MRRRFALHSATTGSVSLLATIDLARDAGFDAVEISHEKLELHLAMGGTLRDVRDAFTRAGIEPLALHTREALLSYENGGTAAIDQRARALCARAATIGCSALVVEAAICPDPLRLPLCRETTAATLEHIAGIAGEYGVRVGLEFVGAPESSIRTLAQARAMVAATRNAIGVVIDAFQFYAGGSTWSMLDGLDPSLLCLVRLIDAEQRPLDRLRDAHRALPGDGVVPLRELLRRVEQLGYDGAYSIQLCRPEYWRWEPRRLARVSRESVEAMCAEADEQSGVLDYA